MQISKNSVKGGYVQAVARQTSFSETGDSITLAVTAIIGQPDSKPEGYLEQDTTSFAPGSKEAHAKKTGKWEQELWQIRPGAAQKAAQRWRKLHTVARML